MLSLCATSLGYTSAPLTHSRIASSRMASPLRVDPSYVSMAVMECAAAVRSSGPLCALLSARTRGARLPV